MNLARHLFRLLLGRRLPRLEGTCRVSGTRATVLIRRDAHGVPVIEADSDRDAWFGLGFCHGQDRAFQLELLLRTQRGTLCELIGVAALPIDRLSRRVGFRHAADRQLPHVAPDLVEQLRAYVEGAYQGATVGMPNKAHEFALLRAQPTPWEPADVLGILKLQSFLLAANWDVEIARLMVLELDGPEALAAVDAECPDWLPVTAPPGRALGPGLSRLADDIRAFTAFAGHGGGSNNWALAASRTATGRPLLANDPHLSASLPAHWYLAHLRTPQWSARGATFVGIPAITVGHNDHAAWGLTAGLSDNTDLFRERPGPDGRSVLQGDSYVPCEVRREEIRVKDGEPVVEEILVTPRGPVISPALDSQTEALSLRASWLDPKPVEGLLRVHRVRSFDEFRRVLSVWPCGGISMVYADASSAVGWQLAGTVPRRKKGYGLLPLAGWDSEAGWHEEPVPFDEMPHYRCDPAGSDFVASANNPPQPAGTGPFLGCDWMDAYRLGAIVEALSERRDWDVPATLALQTSRRARAWEDFRAIVLALAPTDPLARLGLDLLRGWDGVSGDDSAGATVYELFLAEMAVRSVKAKAPRGHEWALGKGLSPIAPVNFFGLRRTGRLVRLIREQPGGWFARPWSEEMSDALATVVGRLRQRYGEDPARWGWGRLRTLTMHHPMGRRRPFGAIFNLGPIPCGGDSDTIAQASVFPLAPLAPADNIPSLRMAIDVGEWGNSRFVLPGGQSGNPCSPYYDDQFPLWRRGEGLALPWTPAEVRAATRYTLRLEP